MALIPPSIDGPLGNLNEVAPTLRPRKEVNDRFAPILERYERFLDVEPRNMDNYLTGINVQVTPPEIDQFMQMTRMYEHHPHYNSDYGYTGRFISALMQCAIRNGHVDFTLDMNRLQPLHLIGYTIVGGIENKVNVTINGKAGDWCLNGAQYVGIANIQNAGDWCLNGAQYVGIANIQNAGYWCLWSAEDVGTANIENAGDWCLDSARNVGTANIQNAGDECLWYAENVGNVYTPNSDLAQRIKKEHITWKKRCKLHHISQEDFEARMKR